jgi:alkylation response protein AidB-like acyl-CoA dehydrogenase
MATATADGTYEIPQESRDLRDMVRQLAQDKIAPRAGDIDRKSEYPWDVRKLLAEYDILGLPFAEEYGGTGTGTLVLQMAVEEIAKACASSALILMIQELGTLPIQLFCIERVREREGGSLFDAEAMDRLWYSFAGLGALEAIVIEVEGMEAEDAAGAGRSSSEEAEPAR